MRTEESTTGPIVCHGCGQPCPISTKMRTPLACKCGVMHEVIGIMVASGADIPPVPAEVTVTAPAAAMHGQATVGFGLTVTK